MATGATTGIEAGVAEKDAGAVSGLVEREAELRLIEAALDGARDGEGRLVVVEGQAGVGKSRLLEVVGEQAERRGAVVLVARGTELEVDYAMGVVVQLFEPYLSRADDAKRATLFAGAAELARSLFDDATATDGDAASHGMFHGLFWLTANLARPGHGTGPPFVVMILDDAHWADSVSVRFLCHLGLRIEDLPLLLVVAMRTEDEGGELLDQLRRLAVVTLKPAPLSPSAVAAVVHRTFPIAEEGFWQACERVTLGNPFLLVELLASLSAEGVSPTADAVGAVEEAVPQSVLRSVLIRLAHLGEAARKLATAVAVLGDRAQPRHAAALAGLDRREADRACDVLVRAQIIAGHESLTFVHPLMAAAMRADTPPAAAAAAHRAAAELLAAEAAPPEEVAVHLLATYGHGDPWVVEVLQETARRAVARGAPGAAMHLLARALAEPPSAALRGEVIVDLALAEADQGVPEAPARLDTALEDLDDPRRRARALQAMAQKLHPRGLYREAAASARRGIDQLDGADPLAESIWSDYLAAALYCSDLRADAIGRITRLAALMDEGRVPRDPMLLTEIASGLLFAGAPAGRILPVVEAALAAGASAAPALQARVIGTAAAIFPFLGEFSRADQAVAEMMAMAARNGSPGAYGRACAYAAYLDYHRGRLAEAVAHAEQSIELWSFGWSHLGWAQSMLARSRLETGDLESARSAVFAGGQVEQHDDIAWSYVLETRGRLALAEGRHAAALEDLLAAGDHIGRYGIDVPAWVDWRPPAALAASALGRHGQAQELAAAGTARADYLGTPGPLGAALRVAGLVARGPRRQELLSEAVVVLEGSFHRLEHCRALVDLGVARRRGGELTAARDALVQGVEMAEAMGAIVLWERAREELRAAGAQPRNSRRSGVAALTPSELRTARLAASGLSNRTIAQQLFVTTKAVEWNLTHVYQKLGIRSRQKLGAALAGAAPPDPLLPRCPLQ